MDFFSRQRSVPDWNQSLIEQQRALVLGVGGIGCSVARNLCRLGVEELVLVDYDVVAASNVNRQVLFSSGDVGRKKVEAGEEGLQRHNIRTKITAVHCNAVTEWGRIVELAQSSTVIFNGIDYGEYFDYAVMSLCVSLSVPYVSASSYGHTAIAECYPVINCPRNGPCWACNNPPAQTELLQLITPDKIHTLDTLEFLPKDVYMPSNQDVGSSILPCTMAANIATGTWINSLHGYSTPHWTSCDFAMFQMFSYPAESNPECLVCRHAPRYSAAVVDMYFGTSAVNLAAVPGKTLVHKAGWITNPMTEIQMESARQHLNPCASLGPEYASCYVPAIPASELEIMESSNDWSALPEALHKPLLKTQDGKLRAIRSGNRSAILPTATACYRLKGCGNFVDAEGLRFPFPGFPLQNLEAKEGVEIKGCCFRHTAATEQYMSERVDQILNRHAIPVGNRPAAMWKYSIPEEPLPKVEKYCGVFETLGEKRLASHLLPGVEALLPLLFPNITLEQVLALFPADRLAATSKGDTMVRPTWSACCTGDIKCSPINMCNTPLPEAAPSSTDCPAWVTPQLLGAWCQAAYSLRQILPLSTEETISCGSLASLLFWQLGWEVGMVKHVLETSDINWGYFFDHNPFEPHCNSHPNNFVVLPPGSDKLLAPVDFDLAFSRQGFISPYTGTPDNELFDSWLASEHTELERALAGEQANTGVAMVQTRSSSKAHTVLSWSLRDTLLTAYRTSYAGGIENPHPVPPRLRGAMDTLVQLSLISTHSSAA